MRGIGGPAAPRMVPNSGVRGATDVAGVIGGLVDGMEVDFGPDGLLDALRSALPAAGLKAYVARREILMECQSMPSW